MQVLGEELDPAAVLRGEVTPMFFGSAMTNFGVEPFLNHFIDFAARPGDHETKTGASISPTATQFTGLVFKLQVGRLLQNTQRLHHMDLCHSTIITEGGRGVFWSPESCLWNMAHEVTLHMQTGLALILAILTPFKGFLKD